MKLIFLRLIQALLLACILSACTSRVVQGPDLNFSAIEADLKKGVSTKMDVQRIMGVPQGFGGAVFPVATAQEQEIWFYQNILVDNIKSQQSYVTMDMDQKVLLVFFSNGLFDGFLWFKNSIKGTGQ